VSAEGIKQADLAVQKAEEAKDAADQRCKDHGAAISAAKKTASTKGNAAAACFVLAEANHALAERAELAVQKAEEVKVTAEQRHVTRTVLAEAKQVLAELLQMHNDGDGESADDVTAEAMKRRGQRTRQIRGARTMELQYPLQVRRANQRQQAPCSRRQSKRWRKSCRCTTTMTATAIFECTPVTGSPTCSAGGSPSEGVSGVGGARQGHLSKQFYFRSNTY
jgi:hypothetical protein